MRCSVTWLRRRVAAEKSELMNSTKVSSISIFRSFAIWKSWGNVPGFPGPFDGYPYQLLKARGKFSHNPHAMITQNFLMVDLNDPAITVPATRFHIEANRIIIDVWALAKLHESSGQEGLPKRLVLEYLLNQSV